MGYFSLLQCPLIPLITLKQYVKTMDKKAYIAPEMEVMNVETETMIAMSVVVDEEGQDDVTGNSRGRRGSWGNLWEN